MASTEAGPRPVPRRLPVPRETVDGVAMPRALAARWTNRWSANSGAGFDGACGSDGGSFGPLRFSPMVIDALNGVSAALVVAQAGAVALGLAPQPSWNAAVAKRNTIVGRGVMLNFLCRLLEDLFQRASCDLDDGGLGGLASVMWGAASRSKLYATEEEGALWLPGSMMGDVCFSLASVFVRHSDEGLVLGFMRHVQTLAGGALVATGKCAKAVKFAEGVVSMRLAARLVDVESTRPARPLPRAMIEEALRTAPVALSPRQANSSRRSPQRKVQTTRSRMVHLAAVASTRQERIVPGRRRRVRDRTEEKEVVVSHWAVKNVPVLTAPRRAHFGGAVGPMRDLLGEHWMTSKTRWRNMANGSLGSAVRVPDAQAMPMAPSRPKSRPLSYSGPRQRRRDQATADAGAQLPKQSTPKVHYASGTYPRELVRFAKAEVQPSVAESSSTESVHAAGDVCGPARQTVGVPTHEATEEPQSTGYSSSIDASDDTSLFANGVSVRLARESRDVEHPSAPTPTIDAPARPKLVQMSSLFFTQSFRRVDSLPRPLSDLKRSVSAIKGPGHMLRMRNRIPDRDFVSPLIQVAPAVELVSPR